MAEADDEDYEVKEEELVDFEGSDYGFDSEEEVEVEEEEQEDPAPATSSHRRFENERPFVAGGDVEVDAEKKDGPESGEIEEEKDEREGVVVQPLLVVVASRQKKPRKADLEDGELDDAAMPEGSDPEAEANVGDDDEGDIERRERKRRKDRFAAERHLEKNRKDAEEPVLAQSMQYRVRGSDKAHIGRGNNYSRVIRGSNVAVANRSNSGPGIMGPGRPLVPMEFAGPNAMRPMGRGFSRPIGGIVAAGRPIQVEINQNMSNYGGPDFYRSQQMMRLAQEHAQAQQQAQAQAHAQAQAQAHAQAQQAAVRAHMATSRQLSDSMQWATSPFAQVFSVEEREGQQQVIPAMARAVIRTQIPTPDFGQQIHMQPPMEGYRGRVPRGPDSFSSGRGATGGSAMNQANNGDRASSGRVQNAWSSSTLVPNQIHNLPAGRGRGRGQVFSLLWGDPQVPGIHTGFPSPLGVIGHAATANTGPGMLPGGMMALGTPKRQGPLPIMIPGNISASREGLSNMKKVDGHPEPDGTWRGDLGNRGGPNGNGVAPHSRMGGGVWTTSPGAVQAGSKRNRDNQLERRNSFGGSTTGAKTGSHGSVGNGIGINSVNAGNHLIQLGGPVTKSRVVSVSGFPENTSMAVVVEAFEKQGKILDFKKDEKGNAFQITFSSVPEAVSAKRSLHRSLLNGCQITVEYAVQRY